VAEVGLDGAGIDAVTVVPMLFAVITDAARTHSLIIPCSEGISAKSDRLLPESRDSLLIACSEAKGAVPITGLTRAGWMSRASFLPDLSYIVLHWVPHMRFRQRIHRK
jgi:hypothetical protein